MRPTLRSSLMSTVRGARRAWWLLGTLLAATHPSQVWAQPGTGSPAAPGPDILTQFLQFTYTIAHAVGQAIVGAIQTVLSQARITTDLVDPIGFLAVLTVFVLLAGVARRIAWIIVAVGWVLIGARIALAILGR